MDAVGGSGYGQLIGSIRLDLLEVLGDEYIFEHFLAEHEKALTEKAYRIYVTDVLYAISNGKSANARYIDVIENRQENKSGSEIKQDIKNRLNGVR